MKERAVFGIEAVQLLRCTAHMSVVLRNKGPGNFRCCKGGQNEHATGWCKRTIVLVKLRRRLRGCDVGKHALQHQSTVGLVQTFQLAIAQAENREARWILLRAFARHLICADCGCSNA